MSRYVKDSNGNWQLSAGMSQIDDELDITSENPIQNKVVSEEITTLTNQKADKPMVVTLTDVSSSNLQFTVSGVTANHVVIESAIANPSAQLSDWAVNTNTDTITISGIVYGTTNVTLTLIETV